MFVRLAVALLPLLGGCVSAPPPSRSTAPWIPPRAAQKADAVWTAVRAQKQDFSKPLTLAELADIALRNNPASRKAWNDARAASAQVDQARGYFMPTITGTAGISRQRTTAEPDSFSQDYMKYAPGLQVNYLILNFGGGRQAAVEEALQTVYAANFTFNRTIQDILLAVETAYYAVVSAQAGIETAEASLKDAATALDVAEEREKQGVGTKLDVLQAQAGRDQALYDLASVRGQLQVARGALALALGIPADTEVLVAPPATEAPDAINAPDLQRLVDDALRRRPDIAALRATLAAREAAVTVAGSPLWPSLFLTGNASRDYYDNINGKAFQDHDWSYGGGLSLQWPLFDGLQTRSARNVARAQAASAAAQLKQAELAASAEVWTTYHDYETALQKRAFSAAFLKSATASHGLALDSYKAGLTSILDLLNAESRLAQARSQDVAVRQEVFRALADLAHATGGLEAGGAGRAPGFISNSTTKDRQP